jgi:O-antigen/teichoic acid export membrane protein
LEAPTSGGLDAIRASVRRFARVDARFGGPGDVLDRLVRGASWAFVGALGSRTAQLLSSVIAAQMLGRSGFGELAMVQTTVVMCGAVAGFGLGTTETRYISKYRSTDPARAGRIIRLCNAVAWLSSLLTAAALFLAAPWVARVALGNPAITNTLRISAVLVLVTNVNTAQLGVLAGLEAFKSIAAVNLWSGLSAPFLMSAGIAMGGVGGAVGALSAGMAITSLLCHYKIAGACAAAGIPRRASRFLQERELLWRFSLPVFVGGSLNGLANWVCTAMLARLPGGYAEVGLFSAAYQLKRAPETIVSILLTPLLPVITERRQSGDTKGYHRALRAATLVSSLVILPAILVLLAAPNAAMKIFGHGFTGGESVTRALAIHLLALALFMPSATALASAGKVWLGAAVNALGAAIYVALSFLLVPSMKGTGVAVAYGINTMAAYLITYFYMRSYHSRTGQNIS